MTHDIAATARGTPRTTMTGRVDLYRDVHKALRHALLTVTLRAGRLDATEDQCVLELLSQSRNLVSLLRRHDQDESHPDLQALIAEHAGTVRDHLDDEHHALDDQLDAIATRADELAARSAPARPSLAHAYYLELAAFTGACFTHFDTEERVVMPALAAACDDTHLRHVHERF
jgi:hypothetical protein